MKALPINVPIIAALEAIIRNINMLFKRKKNKYSFILFRFELI